ncbi:MAG: metalloenzyme [Peptococcaceae bacterium]|nr:metalloenzyme [Peptococcaceae bacterium]
MHLTMIFVDGLGLGSEDNNPVYLARTPHIDRLLGGHFLWGKSPEILHNNCILYSLDATMGVPGIPQSATGQTALWTGVNTAALLGYHLRGFPNEELKEIINKESIFKKLRTQGKKVTFANAFFRNVSDLDKSDKADLSASTLCALAGGLKLRTKEDLLAGKAVFQDITNVIFRQREAQLIKSQINQNLLNQGYVEQGQAGPEEVPIIEPFTAGRRLAGLSKEYDFTLFEYFQTDIKGHKGQPEKAIKAIETLDEFLGGYLEVAESLILSGIKMALILTSDHGNIEDLTTSTHTLNKVPALCWSNYGLKWPRLESITDVTPAIIDLLNEKNEQA